MQAIGLGYYEKTGVRVVTLSAALAGQALR